MTWQKLVSGGIWGGERAILEPAKLFHGITKFFKEEKRVYIKYVKFVIYISNNHLKERKMKEITH